MVSKQKCPRCNWSNTHSNGYNITKGFGKVERWYCNDCHKAFQPTRFKHSLFDEKCIVETFKDIKT